MTAVGSPEGPDRLVAALGAVLEPALDVLDALDRVTEACVRFTSASEAGIVLADTGGSLHVVASTSERSSEAEEAQLGSEEGSGQDCFRSGTTVDVPDLATRESTWPVFVRTMRARGLLGAFAEPIRLRSETLGSLCVFADHDRGHDEPDVAVIQLLAEAASAALVAQRGPGRSRSLDEQIVETMAARRVLDQAKGALAYRRGIGIDEASRVLHEGARTAGRRLRDVAEDVVRRGSRLDDR